VLSNLDPIGPRPFPDDFVRGEGDRGSFQMSSFRILGLSAALLRGVAKPAIPAHAHSIKVIPVVLEGRDVLGGADGRRQGRQSFTLPLHRLSTAPAPQGRRGVRALITPTRDSRTVQGAVRRWQYVPLRTAVILAE
jgi:hypothetical protein